MKKHQFEEITMSLSIIICLISYSLKINWLFYIFLVKSIIDTICALVVSYNSVLKDK